MSIIHIRQIETHLLNTFARYIDMTDYENKSESEKKSALLTRSLAAFSVFNFSETTEEFAGKSITDGYGDNGIDAVHYDENEKILYIAQSKWHHDGTGSIDRGDVLKFINGAKDILAGNFSKFNSKIQNKKDVIEKFLYDASAKICLIIIHSGQQQIGQESIRDLDEYIEELNDASDVISRKILRQGDIHRIISGGAKGAPINFDVMLRHWGKMDTPYTTFYGQVSAKDVASWYEAYYPRLFAPNLRLFLGSTDINSGLIETLKTTPEKFFYFNNGITALCSNISKKPIGGDSKESGYFECCDVSIVNGAQTVGSIASIKNTHPDKLDNASVFIRFISLEKCPEGFGTEVTRATNTQNRIDKRDFVSLDPEQERIRTELQLSGIHYFYKSGERISSPEDSFDLIEATIALAVAQGDVSLAVQAKREIGKLWDDISKAPYKVLFNNSLSGINLWNFILILRKIEETLIGTQESCDNRTRMYIIHGNRFIAHQVFKHLDLSGLQDPKNSISGLLVTISAVTLNYITKTMESGEMLYPDSYLAHLFKNLSKCRKLDEALA